MKELTISGIEIQKGKTMSINLELPKLYGTPTYLPIKVLRGKREGPIVFVSAAIHGDELNGVEIIRRLRKLNILKKLKGTLILVPIVNIYGTIMHSRYLPDRRDLNRSFPGSSKGSLTARIAKIFFDEIVLKSDFGIDLHTASIYKSNLPQIRTDIHNKFTFSLAKAFEAPVILHSELREGSLRKVAQKEGIPVIVYEAGEALRFDEKAIQIGVKGIVNVLQASNMLPKKSGKFKKKIPVVTKSSSWLRSPESGMIRTIKALGDTVVKDEVIAYIDDVFEDEIFEIKAPYDGIIIGKSEIPLIQEGDAIFHIANFHNLELAEDKIEYFSEDALEETDIIGFHTEDVIE